ncbi:MAG TPA: prolyl oligopeptidase family serine peptidase [Pirellulales bacterium]|nr:prolyl oligopeptidase family serine peptidase [Pirellulales bacterium]
MPRFVKIFLLIAVALSGSVSSESALAAEPQAIPRLIPPPGIELSAGQRQELQAAVDRLAAKLKDARGTFEEQRLTALLPDAEILLKGASYALSNGEFYSPGEVKAALDQLKLGAERLDEWLAGKPSWTAAKKLLVRGYRSRIDDSVQPYGLEIPEQLDLSKPCPLYVWLHGRGDKKTEVAFIAQRMRSAGPMAPDGAIVLHPFGRYCNAFKFAGETDVFEAIAAVQSQYKIDPDRIVLAGFSMGGAGAWHLGAHYAERWAAVSPGAGFAETRRYQNLAPDKLPPVYEQTLWGLYDAPDYVRTLFNVPVVAYSGENDKQIQAARVMEEAYQSEGRELTHLIGPGMGHKYHPDTLAELRQRLAKFAAQGRNRFPKEITLQTRTLRYSRYAWVEMLGLDRHWQDSRVDAKLGEARRVSLATKNVTALRLTVPWADVERFPAETKIEIDGQAVSLMTPQFAGAELFFERRGGKWQSVVRYPETVELRKRPGLQGPIDDAFFEPFLVVTPSKKSAHPQVEAWVQSELAHFVDRWRRLFRGDVRIKRDDEVSEEDLKNYHLVAWGDPGSNSLLAKAAAKLPLAWDKDSLKLAGQSYHAAGHVPAMIYPNPLNPEKYLVVNSGLTFREAHDGTNSQQTPKLPDWAVIDLSQPPDNRQSGRIAAAGFFDEHWQFANQAAGLQRRLYVVCPGIRDYLEFGGAGILVYDIDRGHKFIKRIETPASREAKPDNIKGVCADAASKRLYFTTRSKLYAIDLVTEQPLWERALPGETDRMSITPDGKLLYVPSFEKDTWNVVDAASGELLTSIETKSGAHNTVVSRDGRRMYLGGLKSPLLFVADTKTHQIVQKAGPFAGAIRPFTINGDRTRAYICVNGLLGFEIGDLTGGKKLYRIEVQGFKTGPVKRHGCPSHGIGLTPDEKEIWVVDAFNQKVHIFDNTVEPPKQQTSISLHEQPGWVTFSLDGKYAYPSTGEVIDAASKQILTALADEHGHPVHSEKMVEIDFQDGRPVAAGDQFGVGRVAPK